MPETISCLCGYRGPGSIERGFVMCPICHLPASTGEAGAAPPPVPGAARPNPRPENEPPPSGGSGLPDIPPPAGEAVAGVYSVACPRGHVAKVPEEMLGEELVCPRCNTPFVPRLTDSVEYRRRQKQRRLEEEERRARRWLTAAIVAAVLIGLSFAAMVVISLAS